MVLEALSGKGDTMVTAQGTAFFLAGVGLITCAHVLRPETYAIRPRESHKSYSISILAKDEQLDLAILAVPLFQHDMELTAAEPATVKQMDPIRLLGFPHYASGNQCAVR